MVLNSEGAGEYPAGHPPQLPTSAALPAFIICFLFIPLLKNLTGIWFGFLPPLAVTATVAAHWQQAPG